ncbi:tetraacyldisaccharide 4'-kinase [uncultured Psychroserpens sp.]|uniref:tetraacyldisaccharide 4'-kinase n=1 Tax=uncultured Psychroserpens sp. TaxID=255436 RepID=UPI00260CBF7F|nr:tetraacyldisaccharide 4'-kinase [uncultured Psychroserpens sp.]
MKLLRKILFPIVPLYYFVTWLRNVFYDLGWKSSKSYELPVICVGNLSVGGTGKTPTIEYLVRLIKDQYKVAILSRGYKRETSGFIIANDQATAKTIGDEPFQFYNKFDDVIVSVDANRQRGISKLIEHKQPDLILLDDAFQHRKVKAGFNILLTVYDNLYSDDIVLPTGNLREPRAGAKRANIILVTKCPNRLSASEKNHIISKLQPLEGQWVFFSAISYSETICSANERLPLEHLKGKAVTLVTGIANPLPLIEYLKSKSIDFEHLNFKDHHTFSNSEIAVLREKEVILTTEKDYVRLQSEFTSHSSQLFYLPISFEIDEEDEFDAILLSYLSSSL